MSPALKFIVGWVVIITFLVIINKTALGHRILYYFLWLAFFSLIVANYKFFENLFSTSPQDAAAQAGQQAAAALGA